MCIDFLNFRVGNSITSDCLFGTNQGEVTTLVSKKHFLLNENAHTGSINLIKVSDKLSDVICVITGGEDGFIKIWSTTMKLF